MPDLELTTVAIETTVDLAADFFWMDDISEAGGLNRVTGQSVRTAFFASGVIDGSGLSSFAIPVSTSPTVNANGEIAVDTTVTDFSHGILKYYGGEELAVIAVPIAQLTGVSDGDVVTYSATNDAFELQPGGGAGMIVGGAVGSSTPGSVLFIDAVSNLAEDNANFNYDDGSKILSIANLIVATNCTIPFSASPTPSTDGEIVLDTTVTDFSHGVLKYFGGEEMAVIAVPIAELTGLSNGDVLSYNSTADEFQFGAPVGGGAIDGSGTSNTLALWSDSDTLAAAAGLTKETDEVLRVTMQSATEAFVIREHASQSVGPFRIEASDGTDKLSLVRDAGGYRIILSGSGSYIGMGDVTFGQSDGLGPNAIIGYNSSGAAKIKDNGGVTNLQVDSNATAGNTRLLVYDVDNATLERVTVGVADSGGAGYKLLRIPN